MADEEIISEQVEGLVEIVAKAYNHRLRAARKELGFNQARLAEAIGIGQTTLCAYERLRDFPGPKNAQKIANFLDKPVEYLFSESIMIATSAGAWKPRSFVMKEVEIEYTQRLQLEHKVMTPEDEFFLKELPEEIERALDTIPTIQADVIRMYFGLGEYEEPLNLDEIGAKYDLTRERVRQIKTEALGKLQHASRSSSLRPFLS